MFASITGWCAIIMLGIAALYVGFVTVRAGDEFRASVAECIADIGPRPDVKDYCEALVRVGGHETE